MSNASPKLIFAGTPDLAAIHLQALLEAGFPIEAVYTQPDRPSGRGRKLHKSPVKVIAEEHGLPVHQPLTFRDENEQQQLKNLAPDLVIVVAYGLLIPPTALLIPRLGWINVHVSLLPRFRGASPIQHAILAGDKETGVSIMQMDPGLDTGPLFQQASCPILNTDTTQDLHERIALLGSQTLVTTLPQILNQTLKATPQNDDKATYAGKITKQEALIDWTASAIDIERKIRAFIPMPVAFTHLNEEPIRIWEGRVILNMSQKEPGTIIHCNKQGLDVVTGAGLLRITKLQLPGKKPLPVKDILNAHSARFAIGQQFI